ncbi:MAG: hypothetical protein JJV93_00190 [Alphaproteobacteria bacterium]|nr:hypothetical protein [Alphaproteobacteria bacterium]MBL0717675.1 hypothetical protein [Alphaproteobacteria bacterium]
MNYKSYLFIFLIVIFVSPITYAYKSVSTRTLGKIESENQNITVNCTTNTGTLSNQLCYLRRYAKCNKKSNGKYNCNGWNEWTIVGEINSFDTWQQGARYCCGILGLQ